MNATPHLKKIHDYVGNLSASAGQNVDTVTSMVLASTGIICLILVCGLYFCCHEASGPSGRIKRIGFEPTEEQSLPLIQISLLGAKPGGRVRGLR